LRNHGWGHGSTMDAFLAWLQSTSIATAIGGSTALTGSLSAVHVVGFMLVMGGALVANLRGLHVLLAGRPAAELAGPANRVIVLGLLVSVVTGALLFSARATDVGANGTFQLKMLLLVAAALAYFVANRAAAGPFARAGHGVSLALWLGLAVTACAFILLE
jgi:hypothetical protein